jgi:hypothetical protein
MSTLLLKKIEIQGSTHVFMNFIPVVTSLMPPLDQLCSVIIVFALTNSRAIDQNNKTVWKGDERAEL